MVNEIVLSQGVQEVLDEVKKRSINNIFFIACGGSLAVMVPNKYFIDREADRVAAHYYNAAEVVQLNPRTLNEHSVVILLSLTGTTPETTSAAEFARSKGALTVALTCDTQSPLGLAAEFAVGYENAFDGKPINPFNGNFSIMYQLGAGVLDVVEGKNILPKLLKSLENLAKAIDQAKAQYDETFQRVAKEWKDEKVIYTLASGANYGPAYSHAICNLMEMQWIHSHAIHAGEFFHGPFEIVDKETPFVLLMGLDETRPLEERALDFLNRFGEKTLVVDAKDIQLEGIEDSVKGYIVPILFNNLMWQFVSHIAELRQHPLFTARRYMKKVQY
ncbi:SIS domain-containing protein [Ammoniphilus sp. YIM 78166]|uniref:SIS domain-containing protein n=1 Tax=Ammoniphilus sp. YIM 78166 TaxID=1644106 RepID=UPI00106F659A|nr:SIS domain-containing protein [Ammoniphilus sp. YIM 78166]